MAQLSLHGGPARIACVHLPALPLQLLLRAHPDWRPLPTVVVRDDRPLSPILWANRPARALKIERGLKFAQARALSSQLRAAVVADTDVEAAVDTLFDALLRYSPHIEPVLEQPGLFWLDPCGLGGLFGDLQAWAAQVDAMLTQRDFVGCVAVGHMRPFVYALSCQRRGPQVWDAAAEERALARRVPLSQLPLEPETARQMALLGIQTLGQFMNLPRRKLTARYGPALSALHDFLHGRRWTPLRPRIPCPPLQRSLQVEPADDDWSRLLFGIKRMLHGVGEGLSGQCLALTALDITLQLDHAPPVHERIETAAPTLDEVQVLDLVRLRLMPLRLPAAVEQIDITFGVARVHPRQVQLLSERKHRRDLDAAARAIARLRAAFGPAAVTRASLHDAHLPEASFRYAPTARIDLPSPPTLDGPPPMVRRVLRRPLPLPPRPNHEPERWLGEHGAVRQMHGPYRTAGGWWSRRRERDYYYLETDRGELLWAYYDRPARRWYLHGLVN